MTPNPFPAVAYALFETARSSTVRLASRHSPGKSEAEACVFTNKTKALWGTAEVREGQGRKTASAMGVRPSTKNHNL